MEIKKLTNKKVYHKLNKEILKVSKDYGNGELLFDNGLIGRDDDIIVMEEMEPFIQHRSDLYDEFQDLLYSDPDFNYSDNEFTEWYYEQVLTQ